jgi:hypothetical protein
MLADHAAGWLAAWDRHGWHRTATAGDEAGARWLQDEAAALGAEPFFEKLLRDRLDPVAACLELAGAQIPAVPVFDAPATGSDGISGALGLLGSEAAIGVVELSPRAVYTPEYEKRRRGAAHRGLDDFLARRPGWEKRATWLHFSVFRRRRPQFLHSLGCWYASMRPHPG